MNNYFFLFELLLLFIDNLYRINFKGVNQRSFIIYRIKI